MPGFFISKADASGNRIAAADKELTPGPGQVEYPHEAAGAVLETAEGRTIQQQVVQDGRRRTWVWRGYPAWLQGYKNLWTVIEPLRSRYRTEFGAATPYIYIKEDVTDELKRSVFYSGTATAASATTVTDSAQAWGVNALVGYVVELTQGSGAGEFRTIISNTATQVTTPAWSPTVPDTTTKYAIRGKVSDWFRARVLEVSRDIQSERFLTYEETRLVFVIDDPTFIILD